MLCRFSRKRRGSFATRRFPRSDQVKYSTVHLYEGIELLLKSRLLSEHWFVLAERKCTAAQFARGDFVSVSLGEIWERLRGICGLPCPEQARCAFDELRQLRNRFVHFYWCGRERECWPSTVKALSSGAETVCRRCRARAGLKQAVEGARSAGNAIDSIGLPLARIVEEPAD